MIILNNKKLIESKFANEQEVEDLTIENSEHFFGPSSIFIPKAKITTIDGTGTIPDGFAVDLASRSWFVVEAELGHHSVWTHIAPQVAKQLIASSRPETRQLIAELVVQMVNSSPEVAEKFDDEGIKPIDIRMVLGEILEKAPIVGMPIDRITNDLKAWAETLKNEVRLWIVRKYVQFGDTSIVAYDIPEEHRPVLDTGDTPTKSGIQSYDVSISDLIESGLLAPGDTLVHTYKPRGGEKHVFEATVEETGNIKVLDQTFSSLSYAAVACIQKAGSNRKTVNGWTSWRAPDGKTTLAELRDLYLAKKESEVSC